MSLLCLFCVLPFRPFPFMLGTEGSDDGCPGLLELLIANRRLSFYPYLLKVFNPSQLKLPFRLQEAPVGAEKLS